MNGPLRDALLIGLVCLGLVLFEPFRSAIFYFFWISPFLGIFVIAQEISLPRAQAFLVFLYCSSLVGLPLLIALSPTGYGQAGIGIGYLYLYYLSWILPLFMLFLSAPVLFLFFRSRHWFDQAFLSLLIVSHAMAISSIDIAIKTNDIKGSPLTQGSRFLFSKFIQYCSQSETCNLFEISISAWLAMAGLHVLYILICLIRLQIAQTQLSTRLGKYHVTTPPRRQYRR